MSEQGVPQTTETTPSPDVISPAEVVTPPVRSRRRPPFRGALGSVLVVALAFAWGALAYRELGPSRVVAADLSSASTRVGTGVVQGSESAPVWIGDFATAFCDGDATAMSDRLGPPLSGQVEDIKQALATRTWGCDSVHYLGGGTSTNGSFYIYLLRDGPSEMWWVFTTQDDQVIEID
jgi:hypothetical protein